MRGNTFYQLLNAAFIVFHVALIVFNLFGWMIQKLRRWNFISLCITAFSWIVLGAFYGFGYCFLTDWHWAVREKLGYATESNSYIHFLILATTGVRLHENFVDILTAILFFAAFFTSAVLNFSAAFRKK